MLSLVEMMGEGGVGDAEFFLDFVDDQTVRVCLQEQLHDAQAGFGAHGGKHVGVAGDVLHISIIPELWGNVKAEILGEDSR